VKKKIPIQSVAGNKVRIEKKAGRFTHIPVQRESLEPRLLLTADPLFKDDYVNTVLNVDVGDCQVMDTPT
jgi:hypothetical protein